MFKMAEKKKNNAKKPVSNKKNTGNAVSSAKAEEFISLFTLVGGILLGVFLYFPEGFVGSFIKDIATGLFGWPVYLAPVLLIVNGIHKAARKNYELHKSKYIVIGSGLGVLSVLTHIFAVKKENPFSFSNMLVNYGQGGDGIGGGLLGGFIADLLRTLIGQVASAIVAITAVLVVTMILVDWSPVKMLLRAIVKTYAKTNNARITVKNYAESEREKRKTAASESDMPEGDAEFVNFSDEELGIKGTHVAKVKKKKKKGGADAVQLEAAAGENQNEADLEPLETEEIAGIDDIIEQAVPAQDNTLAEKTPPEIPVAAQETQASVTAPAPQAENQGAKIVDAPEKLTGMEDVSEEMEDVFERIPYTFPSVSLLNSVKATGDDLNSRTELRETAQKLIATLKSFNVEAKLLNVSKGPAVTRYELVLGEGIKVSKVVGLANDLALRLAAPSVRIEPVPGKEAIGIEIPNKSVSVVHIKEVLDSDEFRNFKSTLAFAMGKDISGKNIVFDLSRMPHVLIAGSTGSGKSVCINTLITSLIYKADPNDVKLLMVDPKVVELGIYNGIPHLLIPVVTEPRRASGALYWAVQEMLRRYSLFADNNVRDIKGYNKMVTAAGSENTLPHIVIIIDELADLMMVAPNEVEDSICRLAQMARAAGMHLVIATQRPSVDVITGLIKANVPSRIAFAVSSHIDSRTILDSSGAEKLLGRGDMLFKPVGASKPLRIQGAFIDDKEVERVVEFIKGDSEAKYDEDIIEKIDAGKPVNITDEMADPSDNDELLPKAIEIAVEAGKISASHLQRRLKVGFSRASRMIDQMQERGIVGPPDGSKPREVLISKEDYLEMSMQ